MSSPRDVVYAGFTTYKVEPGRILVQVQNPNPNAKIEAAVAKPTGPRGTGEYMVAQFTPGLEYNLKSEPNFPPAKFVLVSRDISYWQKIGGFSRFGEARPLKGMQDFDAAHEIKKALVAVLQTYGPILSWT